jgi:hypothetical protein
MAVVATLSKGYDLDYVWKQVDRGPAKDAAGYYIQASESGESRRAVGGAPVRVLSASSTASSSNAAYMTCCSASAKPQTAHPSESLPSAAGKPPTCTPACWPASRMPRSKGDASCASRLPARPGSARCSSTSRSRCPSRSRSSTPHWEKMPDWPARPATTKATGTGPPWSTRSTT